ncbi:MAG: calcium/sodium antiporter [Desulfobacteraceae bacterium]|nr:calcium/sodium antiporter [Desulfobacteraceae bacterium]
MIGLVALTLGAEGLVRGSASLAIRLGLTPLIIGLTIVSFGTSMPEMVVSVGASLNNQSDIAIGNVVGSNIFNIGVILGITALICPIHVNLKLVKIDIPIMIVAALVSLILVSTGTVSRLTGVLLFSGLIAYTVFTVFMAEKENRPDIKLEFQEGIPGLSKSLSLDFLFIGGGLLLLILGSRLLVLSATDFARILGISEAVIALTIIAAGTSLPELATSFVAALRRQPDIAVGNVVGSNIFNLLGILGASAMVKPLKAVGITAMDLWVMVAYSILLLPLAYGGLKLYRWKGGLLLTGYGIYLWALWP